MSCSASVVVSNNCFSSTGKMISQIISKPMEIRTLPFDPAIQAITPLTYQKKKTEREREIWPASTKKQKKNVEAGDCQFCDRIN
jgi:hypothetical protein